MEEAKKNLLTYAGLRKLEDELHRTLRSQKGLPALWPL